MELGLRFWVQEHKREFWITPHVVQALDSLGVSYNMDYVHAVVDLTSCFTKGFQQLKDNSKRVLDFITQAKMSRYTPAVAETCTKYLSSIAYGKPDKFLITHVADVILVEGENEQS